MNSQTDNLVGTDQKIELLGDSTNRSQFILVENFTDTDRTNNWEGNYHMGTEVNLRVMRCVDDTCSNQEKFPVIIDTLSWFYRAHIILVLGVIAALSLSISTFHSLLDETPLDMFAGGVIGT